MAQVDRAGARVLVVDDDPRITSMLRRSLTHEGYAVETAADGAGALKLANRFLPDLVILDLMLPGMDGFQVCRGLRQEMAQPLTVLMLTARDEVADRVAGLDSGADDYLVKPFALAELLARVRALLRRTPREATGLGEQLSYADLALKPGTREAWRGGSPLELTKKEFDLLELFLRNPRRVLTRDVIMEQVWGYDFIGESNVLEVYVGYLRAKLEANGGTRVIHTVRGVGYVLRDNP